MPSMNDNVSNGGCAYTGLGDPEMIYLSPVEAIHQKSRLLPEHRRSCRGELSDTHHSLPMACLHLL